MIKRLLQKVISWIAERVNIKKLLAVAFGIGAVGAVKGAADAHGANKINRHVLSIQKESLKKHELELQYTKEVLDELGEIEKKAIDSFTSFADTMEKIQGRPKIKTNAFSRVKIPNYEPEEIKCLTADLQMALVGVAGAGAGALAGLAAFGAGAIIAAPAMISTGVVLCAKGMGLKKKAIENEKQAKKLQKSVNEIVTFYKEVRDAASKFSESVNAVFSKYNECLIKVSNTLMTKTTWKEFSRAEKKNTENAVLLARLLYQMCQTNVIVQKEKEDKLETINSNELRKLERQSVELLADIA